MGYYNPIFSYGVSRFVGDAATAGADGFIVPDLPLEEAGELEGECRAQALSLIPMLAPTSTPERIAEATKRATGFIYLVSLTGVTGERKALPDGLKEFVGRVKESAAAPVAVGFGISTPEQAAEVGQIADGVIIGSAVVKAMGSDKPIANVKKFIKEIHDVLTQA
jgi:tryptophan synthase alpha chain